MNKEYTTIAKMTKAALSEIPVGVVISNEAVVDLVFVIAQTVFPEFDFGRKIPFETMPIIAAGRFADVTDHEAARIPAVPVEKSVLDDFIICLEDGQRFKMMKRHLAEKYGLTPDEYRNKWNLPSDYPMTAPSYSRSKGKIARKANLGRYARH